MHRPLFPRIVARLLCSLALATACMAQTASSVAPVVIYTKLADFGEGNGQRPNAFLAQATDGNFYSTTYEGGSARQGTAFQMTPEGVVTTLHNFCFESSCYDGRYPDSGVIQGADGNFYGTTLLDGDGPYRTANEGGSVFSVTAQGVFTTIYSFCSLLGCRDGANPQRPLLQGSNGNLYGITAWGGEHRCGTVFELTLTGTLTTLYNFCSLPNAADGNFPQGLMQASDGNFYGATLIGGTSNFCTISGGCGTIFKLNPQGGLTTLYNFCLQADCIDGYYPVGTLSRGTDGELYGATGSDGNYGSIFKISPSGKLTTLHTFCSLPNCADGDFPYSLIPASDGNFYGITAGGGIHNWGTAFEITPQGTLTTLYAFCSDGGVKCSDGSNPQGIVQGSNGSFYGVTYYGGRTGNGAAFQLATGLAPLP
jgi:uncharacterized repeat protein (TIGR03803 family)